MSFFQKRRWLVEFGVVCLVPIVLIGLFLMQTLKANVKGRALSNAREQARLVADVGLSTPLAGIDDLSHGLTTGQQQAIDHQLGAIRSGNTLQRALIRDRASRGVYANDRRPNRTMFTGLVQSTLNGAGRRRHAGAVMLMDLDRFKDVNDTLGHHNGDLLLQRIASRLDSVLRNTATVARLGGDEFAILLTDASDRQQVVPIVRRILKVLEEPVVVGGLALQVEASIGIAMFPEHGRTVDAVMRAADVAMDVTKEQRSGYEFYDEERHEHRHDAGRLALIGELRRAT